MAFDQQAVGQFAQFAASMGQQIARLRSAPRLPLSKNDSLLGLEQLDAQAFAGHGHLDLILELSSSASASWRFQLLLEIAHFAL